MRARLKDVALRAGVSVKTVSNVVNGYVHVTQETRDRVQRAIDELDYRPNLSARSLRVGRSGIIALAVPRLDEPYFAELAGCIVSVADRHRCTVLIEQTEGRRDREALAVRGIRPELIDGLILSPLALGPDDLSHAPVTHPVVLLGERVFAGPFDHVAIDNVAAARTATEHLVEMGRTRIAAIGEQRVDMGHTGRLRRQGYQEALRAAGLPPDEGLVGYVEAYHRADGAAAMRVLMSLPRPPDAVFCFNDLLALGAIRALHDLDLRVPQDVAVVGFDDIDEGRFSTPTLTSVAPDKSQIAEHAISALLRRLGGASEPPHEVSIDYALVVRQSTSGGSAQPLTGTAE